MIHNMVQLGNILCISFVSFGELHFRPTFDAGAVRRRPGSVLKPKPKMRFWGEPNRNRNFGSDGSPSRF